MAIKVTIYNEYVHERNEPSIAKIYPEGIHTALKNGLACDDFEIRTATLDMPENGLSEEVLNDTDVLIWWGHVAHGAVLPEVVNRVVQRVNDGMGFIALHSAHHSLPFTRLTGCTCNLQWREVGEKCRVWAVNPNHPICKDVPHNFLVEHEEMYGEPFVIPEPDETVFISWYEGGNVFRSGVTYHRGAGKIFYFQNGHEAYPNYYDKNVLQVIKNAVHWAYNPNKVVMDCWQQVVPAEKIEGYDPSKA